MTTSKNDITATVVFGLAWGDEGKGKITSQLTSSGTYDMVCRWAGGNNAGHTIYKAGEKYKTHIIPSGVFYDTLSVIGPGCVVHWSSFLNEIKYLESHGFDTSLVKISPKAHIVFDEHIDKDKQQLSKKLGTTSKGIAPCYEDKAGRRGIRAGDIGEIVKSGYLWDEKIYGNVLCEGAQGFWLDMDWGNYPYVTSSTTLPYAACSLGFPSQSIKKVVGVAKMYDTRSGEDPDFPDSLLDNPELKMLADIGREYGVTTGRRRKTNYLNLDKLLKAIDIAGCTHVIFNKTDILEEAGIFKFYHNNKLNQVDSIKSMKLYIENQIDESVRVVFSGNPERI